MACVLMPTVRVAEPVPVPGVTVSQLPPPEVEGVAVNGTLALTVNATVCVWGAAVPMMYEKLSEVGATWNVAGAATVRVTGTVIGLPDAPFEVIVTLPVYCPGASEPE